MRRSSALSIPFKSLFLLGLLGFLATGCVRGDRETCSYFIKQLKDPNEVQGALKNLGNLSCTKSVEKLEPIFASGEHQEQILSTMNRVMGQTHASRESIKLQIAATEEVIKKADSPESREKMQAQIAKLQKDLDKLNERFEAAIAPSLKILDKGLSQKGTSADAASLIEDWNKAKVVTSWKSGGVDIEASLVKVVGDKTYGQGQAVGIKALAEIQVSAQANEDLYISLLDQDVNSQSIDVFRIATEQLGKMHSTKGLDQIIRALFIKNQRNDESFAVARIALAQIGKPAVTALVHVLSGENEAFNGWAKHNGIPQWKWQLGPKLIMVLGDLRSAEASPAIVANLGLPFPDLEEIPENRRQEFAMDQNNRFKLGSMALQRFGSDVYVEAAHKIAADHLKQFTLRVELTWSFSLLGSSASRNALFEVYKGSKDEFKALIVTWVALGMHKEDLKKYEKVVIKNAKKAKFVGERLESDPRIQAYVNALDKCGNSADCYLALLGDQPAEEEASDEELTPEEKSVRAREKKHQKRVLQYMREKAAIMIAHQPANPGKYFEKLMTAFQETKPVYQNLKRYLFIALAKNASPEYLASIKEEHEQIKGKGRMAFVASDMQALIIWLENKN
jgi:hypothetical protein